MAEGKGPTDGMLVSRGEAPLWEQQVFLGAAAVMNLAMGGEGELSRSSEQLT